MGWSKHQVQGRSTEMDRKYYIRALETGDPIALPKADMRSNFSRQVIPTSLN